MGGSNRERRVALSMKDTRIDPELRIVVPYDGTRPGAPVA
jgi:hypothetical protein